MNSNLTLLPFPRILEEKSGYFFIQPAKTIQINSQDPQTLLISCRQVAQKIKKYSQKSWQVTGSRSIPDEVVAVQIRIDPQNVANPQGYHLVIAPNIIQLTAADQAGAFYGLQTLNQIISQTQDDRIACMEIIDWPDFPVRGVMLDISRDKVYRMETLFMLVDELASWKINQLQLYTEHTFAYVGHETVWQNASPMTAKEMLILDEYCRDRFIELVPNQNSFGHMTRWLQHPEYEYLAEATQPVQTPWGDVQEQPFSLSPTNPDSLTFLSGLYDQLLPNFSSKMINVGCDETFDMCAGGSKAACEEKGRGQIYLDFLHALYWDLSRRGYTMQFWGDIILEHPELVPHLPKQVIALDWGYESNHPFGKETKIFSEAVVPFYVCPGTSSWNSLGGRWDNMIGNCHSAAENGLKDGAIGFLNTDWGDNGHWQQLPISYPGFAIGAAFAWCLESNHDADFVSTLNRIVFKDSSNSIGNILQDLGNMYQDWGAIHHNSSPLFWALQEPSTKLSKFEPDDLSHIHASLEKLNMTSFQLDRVRLARVDGMLILEEIRLTILLMQHACKRVLWCFERGNNDQNVLLLREIEGLIADYKVIWLKRNRVGGLDDSLAQFNIILSEYEAALGKD